MRLSKPLLTSFFGFLVMLALSVSPVIAEPQVTSVEKLFQPYRALLEQYLEEFGLAQGGLISAFDYERAVADASTQELLSEQDRLLAGFDPQRIDSRQAFIAFWSNAYNYFMIQQILTEKPKGKLVDSVWDYGGRYNPFVTNVFGREKFVIGNRKYSLDQMEKGQLLGDTAKSKGWKDARVHFTVNCASVGCPPLRKQIYTHANIDQLMAENTRRAFQTPLHLKRDGTTLYVTSLFDWYAADFTDESGDVLGYIREHGGESIKQKTDGVTEIRYIDYDWRLNRPENLKSWLQ